MDAVFEHLAKYAAKGYEDLVSQFYDIEGFSEILLQNPTFWDNFEKWRIEREMPDLPPSMQMMYIITSTTYIAYLQNKLKNQRVIRKEDTKEEIKEKKEKKEEKKGKKKETTKKVKLEIGDIL